MRPTINTEKHIVQFSLAAVASGAISTLTLAIAKAAVVGATTTHVREGSKIAAIYIEMWVSSDDAASGTTIVTLERLAGGMSVMTTTESASLDSYDNKKNVLHTMMGLTPSNVQYPMAVVKGWFKIPKGKQRMGLEDRLMLNLHGQSNGMAFCGFCVYKEQY